MTAPHGLRSFPWPRESAHRGSHCTDQHECSAGPGLPNARGGPRSCTFTTNGMRAGMTGRNEDTSRKCVGIWIDHREAVLVFATGKEPAVLHIPSHVERHPGPAGVDSSGSSEAHHTAADDIQDRRFTGQLARVYDEVIWAPATLVWGSTTRPQSPSDAVQVDACALTRKARARIGISEPTCFDIFHSMEATGCCSGIHVRKRSPCSGVSCCVWTSGPRGG